LLQTWSPVGAATKLQCRSLFSLGHCFNFGTTVAAIFLWWRRITLELMRQRFAKLQHYIKARSAWNWEDKANWSVFMKLCMKFYVIYTGNRLLLCRTGVLKKWIADPTLSVINFKYKYCILASCCVKNNAFIYVLLSLHNSFWYKCNTCIFLTTCFGLMGPSSGTFMLYNNLHFATLPHPDQCSHIGSAWYMFYFKHWEILATVQFWIMYITVFYLKQVIKIYMEYNFVCLDRSNGYKRICSRFLLARTQVRILAREQIIFTEASRDIPQSLQANSAIVP
jgi:hypothetical protein